MIEALILDGIATGKRVVRIPITREDEEEMIKKLESIGIKCLIRSASSCL